MGSLCWDMLLRQVLKRLQLLRSLYIYFKHIREIKIFVSQESLIERSFALIRKNEDQQVLTVMSLSPQILCGCKANLQLHFSHSLFCEVFHTLIPFPTFYHSLFLQYNPFYSVSQSFLVQLFSLSFPSLINTQP